MLVLARKTSEAIRIGDDIRVTVIGVRGRTVRLGIEAPGEIAVLRAELLAELMPRPDENVGPSEPVPATSNA